MLLYLVVLSYLALVLVGIFLSDRMIFQPQRSSYKDTPEIIKLKTFNGTIISYGRSVGNGASIDLASRRPVGGLIVQSGFTSAFVVLTKIPIVPFDKFRNISKIRQVKCPVLVIHGRKDNVIPFHNGERLFDAAPSAKSNFWVDGAG